MTMVGSVLLKNPASGYRPDGWNPQVATSNSNARDFFPAEVLHTSSFYFLWLAYALGTSAGLMVISQLVPFARSQGISSDLLATMTLVVAACGNAGGRILCFQIASGDSTFFA